MAAVPVLKHLLRSELMGAEELTRRVCHTRARTSTVFCIHVETGQVLKGKSKPVRTDTHICVLCKNLLLYYQVTIYSLMVILPRGRNGILSEMAGILAAILIGMP